MLIHKITIKTFNMQKNCLTFKRLFHHINEECNHKHKKNSFFKINSIGKNIPKKTNTLVLLLHTYIHTSKM